MTLARTGSTTMRRPSDRRREALRQAEGEMDAQVSNFFPIQRYYAAADKVYESFVKAYDEKRLDDAYVLGKRFATFSIKSLPHHDYYNTSRYATLQRTNLAKVETVVAKLEQVTDWMDEEEVEKERLRREYRKKLEQDRVRQQEAIEKAKYKELQDRIEQQKRKSQRGGTANVEQSAMNKLQILGQGGAAADSISASNGSLVSPTSQPLSTDLSEMDIGDRNCKSMSSLVPNGTSTRPETPRAASTRMRRSRWQQQEEVASIDAPGSLLTGEDALPPPIPPPSVMDNVPTPPPPSYFEAVAEHDRLVPPPPSVAAPAGGAIAPSDIDLISFPESISEEFLPPPPPYSFYDRDSKRMKPPTVVRERVPMSKLKEKSNADFASLKHQRKIEVFGLGTYQGRIPNSTNGCTVISPLVVSRHLNSPSSVSDSAIVKVIDKECPPLLRDIRRKLELEGDALIIPSDVHDHLVDRNILSQSKFSGACGGNILDEKHIGEFLRLLEGGETGDHKTKKTGAAFFFHEHVVSVVKCPLGGGKFCYDMVDSMPRLVDAYDRNKLMASRTRCHDLDAFAALLRWYACGKFSSSNCHYIDKNEWNEMMADLDPRVFQAFVWVE